MWVSRPLELWIVQVILAVISLTEALLIAYLGYKVSEFFQFAFGFKSIFIQNFLFYRYG